MAAAFTPRLDKPRLHLGLGRGGLSDAEERVAGKLGAESLEALKQGNQPMTVTQDENLSHAFLLAGESQLFVIDIRAC